MALATPRELLNMHLADVRRDIDLGSAPGNLPGQLTSFVGRELEIASVQALLKDPVIRLVTLTGPGGVGKTRLALKVAESLQDQFDQGVWFVSLASVRDASMLPSRLVTAMGARPIAGRPLKEILISHLRDRRSLIVLDNLEHLLAATPLLFELLESTNFLKILATSRAVLHVYGEHDVDIQPMPVPLSSPTASPAQLMESPAIRIFVDRASAADAMFALTTGNAAATAEICRRLEGLPLAIELADARIGVLSPEAMLERLDRRLPLLIGQQQGQPERFATMRSAIGWSYDLLDSSEQALLQRLSVFVGGFTVEAAETVAGELEESNEPRGELLLERIGSLVEKSLLWRSNADANLRFSMLEVIREFCFEELEAIHGLEEVRHRHAAYYLGRVKTLIPGLDGIEMADNLAQLDIELPNIRSALSWALEGRQSETALRLAADLYHFCIYRGHLAEGRSWLMAGLERGGAQPRTRIDGLLAACGLAGLQGDLGEAERSLREAADLAERESYRYGIARALILRGLVAEWSDDYRTAAAAYAACSQRIEDLGEAHWRSRLLGFQAEVDAVLGDTSLAELRAQTAIALAAEAGHAWNAGVATGVLAYLQLTRGNIEAAVALYWENLNRYRLLGDYRGMGGATAGFAGVAMRMDRKPTAARLLGAARATGDEIGVAHLGNKGLTDQIEVWVRAAMSPSAFQAAWDAGCALGREWAFAEAQALRQIVAGTREIAAPAALTSAGLTRREVDVLYLLVRRLTDKEIADALSISHRTVMHHVSNILSKVGLDNRRQVSEWASEHGLV